MKTYFFICAFALCLIGCKNNSLDNWKGKYIFEERALEANAGYAMVMSWNLELDSISSEKLYGKL